MQIILLPKLSKIFVVDFIQKLPIELERMIDTKRSLQQVVSSLMETGKKRNLTRLWSTSPEEICIIKQKECPVHPSLILDGETMTLAAVVMQVKTRSERLFVVAAASEQEKHAASAELYSQSVIENCAEVILYLNTLDYLGPNEVQQQRARRVESKCKKNADIESKESILIVVEYSGIEKRDFLRSILTFLLRCEGRALIIAAEQSGNNIPEDNLADLKEMVSIKSILELIFKNCFFQNAKQYCILLFIITG
jgi:hypothetical protein